MDLETLKEKLLLEEKALAKLQEESCNLENMTCAQRWEIILPSITLAVESALKSDNNDEQDEDVDKVMDEAEMMSTLRDVRLSIDKKEFTQAVILVRKTEKLLAGACDLRKDKRLEWQVDYFVRMLKKIYVEMNEGEAHDNGDEDKENVENTQEEAKKKNKKGKKRRLQDLHPADDEKAEESEAVKAASAQARVVQYIKVILF